MTVKTNVRELAETAPARASLQIVAPMMALLVGLLLLPGISSLAWSRDSEAETAGVTEQDADQVDDQDQDARRRQLQKSELGAQQQLVERKMVELEAKLRVIAERLRETEKDRADRLIEAYQQAKERLITTQMAKITRLLDENKLNEAGDVLVQVVRDVEDLICLLKQDDEPKLTKKEQIEAFEQVKQDIEDLKREQNEQKRETNKVGNKDETVSKLKAQIEKLNGLIDRQKNVIDRTGKGDDKNLREMDKIADEQFGIRSETENLIKDIAADPTSGTSKDGEGKDGEGKDGEGKDGEGKDGEGKDGEGKDGEGKDQQGQGQQQQDQPPQPGQKALEKATEHQRRAEEKLGSGKTDDAERQEQIALDNMEKTKDELEKEMRRIESLPPEAFEEMAEKQRRMRDKAMDIVQELKELPAQDPQDVSQQSGQQQPPGQQQMQQASDEMQQASNDLDEQDPDEAQKDQQQAEDQMQQALEDIEERLNQLREETREEKLARLEGRFREMLERQIVAGVMTMEIDDKFTSLGKLRRRDQLVLLRLATEEAEISELGQQAYDLLLEDGTSEVFPEIVQGIREDLNKVSRFLESERTDQLTQLLQKDIEATIEQLLEALKEAKQEAKEGGGSGGGGGGEQEEPPLLKLSAEYKILKFRQIRINRRTIQLERIRNEQDAAQNPGDEQLDQEFDDTAAEQERLLEMTEELMKKQQQAQRGGGQ